MKRTIVVLLCAVMLIMVLIPTSAEVVNGSVLSVELLKYYRYETEQIARMINETYGSWDEYLGDDPEAILFDRMYQVYYLEMKDTVSAYDTDGSFAKNISDRYYWVVPNYEKGSEVQVVRNADTQYGWAIRRGTRYMETIANNYEGTQFGIAAIYDSILEQRPDANKLSFKMIYDELNDMHLMYFTAGGEEYVAPYFASENITWLTNGKVYTARDYVELMRDNAEKDTTHIAHLGGGSRDTETIYLYYVIIGTVAVVAVATVAVIVARKKIKERNDIKEENDKKE